MSSLTNVQRLLNVVINGNHPEHLPRSNSEVIQILGVLNTTEEVRRGHIGLMKTVEDSDFRRICSFAAARLLFVTTSVEKLLERASGGFPLQSRFVLVALACLRAAFHKFEQIAANFQDRPQAFKDCCFEYVSGCCKYSITLQKLLYAEDECDHLDYYTESLEHPHFTYTFKIDTERDYPDPLSEQSYEKVLSRGILPAHAIPPYCQLKEQPQKPVCPQFYRNPGFYGPTLLRNMNHPSNNGYFKRKRAYLRNMKINGIERYVRRCQISCHTTSVPSWYLITDARTIAVDGSARKVLLYHEAMQRF